MEILHHYNEHHLPLSAKEIVPIVLEIIKPKSVLDVGCGIGQWLSVFELYGIHKLKGIDGNHVPRNKLMIDENQFEVIDLRKLNKVKNEGYFDLCLCLEVAEHLPESLADQLIDFLNQSSNTILFSAAVPNQTGENHYNEQWPCYWQQKFESHGYTFLDIIRKKIWNNNKVNWWYRQNMFIVTKDSELINKYNHNIFDGNSIIHPELLNLYVQILKSKGDKRGLLKILNSLKKQVIKLF